MSDAKYTFFPYVRLGLATYIEPNNTAGFGSLEIPIKLRLGSVDAEGSEMDGPTLTLRGPADALTIASSQVVRTEPAANAKDFEDNYFPFIEFARPDFPWMLTPLSADGSGRLRPWIVLIVVKEAEVTFTARSNAASVLMITNPQDQLPDLDESDYWAHVQVSGEVSDVATALTGTPEAVVSRLICPRRLDPNTNYRACVVPAFEVGRLAALGQSLGDLDPADLEPAWSDDDKDVDLPVYYTWTFSTGDGGDFEELVRELEPRTLSSEVGVRALDAANPGLGLPPADDSSLRYIGVMKAPDAESSPWNSSTAETFKADLTELLNRAGSLTDEGGVADDPVIAPPIYGRWHAAQDQIADTNPAWLGELNLDPIYRVISGMATKVVKQQQEALMASAWEQLDEIQQVNRALVRAQLAREVGLSLKRRHIDPLDGDARAQLFSPAQCRTPFGNGRSIRGKLQETSLPAGTASAALRRATRPGGSPGRVARTAGAPFSRAGDSILRLFDRDTRTEDVTTILEAELPDPSGMSTTSDFPEIGSGLPGSGLPLLTKLSATDLSRSVGLARSKVRRTLRARPTAALSPELSAMSAAVAAAPTLEAIRGDFELFLDNTRVAEAEKVVLTDVAEAIDAASDPSASVLARIASRIEGLSSFVGRTDSLDIVMAAPDFPQPMYSFMRDVAPDWFMPGLENIEDETISLLETNPPAIEAFMVGLSHEMARELLWREYPTDQRGTYFKHFWDRSSSYTGNDPDADTDDIKPIHEWSSSLGENGPDEEEKDEESAEDAALLVLVLRGQLLRRYPDLIIYSTAAQFGGDGDELEPDDTAPLYPLFSGALGNDISFFGFDLGEEVARSTPEQAGYFFVLQQHPTAPRFGLDATSDGTTISWEDVDIVGGHVSVIETTGAPTPIGATWGSNSAHMAKVTLQLPARAYYHADDMLP
jgi:hypothetical protein